MSALGWSLLVTRGLPAASLDPMAGHHHGGTLPHHGIVDWTAMVLAMSPLVLRSEAGWLWKTSLPRQRGLATMLFGFGYAVPWLLLGLIWWSLFAGLGFEDSWSSPTAIVALLLWQASPGRQRLLNACHRRPSLRAFGFGMMRDTARFGFGSGMICVGICGPAMLFVMALPHYHLVAMMLAAIPLTIERYFPPRRPTWRLPWSLRDRAPHWKSLGFITAAASAH